MNRAKAMNRPGVTGHYKGSSTAEEGNTIIQGKKEEPEGGIYKRGGYEMNSMTSSKHCRREGTGARAITVQTSG